MFHLKQDAGFKQDNHKPQGPTFHHKVSGLLGFVMMFWWSNTTRPWSCREFLTHLVESIWFSQVPGRFGGSHVFSFPGGYIFLPADVWPNVKLVTCQDTCPVVEICQLYLGFSKGGVWGTATTDLAWCKFWWVRIGGMLPPTWPKWQKVGSPWGVDESGANDESSADLSDLTTNDDLFFMGKPTGRCLMSEWWSMILFLQIFISYKCYKYL